MIRDFFHENCLNYDHGYVTCICHYYLVGDACTEFWAILLVLSHY
jgi:hypothetical protein